jgi:hypothetical protein
MQYLSAAVQHWRRPLWLGLLIALSVALTLALACAVPFAAFAAVAALTLARRDALYLTAGVWLANQMVGFAFLHYPWDGTCFAWSAVLGATALLSTLAAQQVLQRVRAARWLCATAAFLAALATYEVALYLAAVILGGEGAFTLSIQIRIFAINGAAMLGLLLLHWLGAALRIAPAGLRSAPA